jgi:hypothetical protein
MPYGRELNEISADQLIHRVGMKGGGITPPTTTLFYNRLDRQCFLATSDIFFMATSMLQPAMGVKSFNTENKKR